MKWHKEVYKTTMRTQDRKPIRILLLSLFCFSLCHADHNEDADTYISKLIADLWLEGADVVRIIWRDCSKKLVDVKDVIDHKEYFPKFVRCMKRKTLRALDRSLSPDIVPIADGVNLVRFELVDRSGNILPENNTSTWSDKELEEGDWRNLALKRMAKVLKTHVIKFDFEDVKAVDKVEFRGRRRHQMMTMMMFGVVSIGMVMIPMGFQFLAVLGGKALLLAKMALILASIQGLKKIAASPLSYGFYHNYPPYDHYEKRSRDDWVPAAVMPETPSQSMAHIPWSGTSIGNIKADKIQIVQGNENIDSVKHGLEVTWKPDIVEPIKQSAEARIYPIYAGPSDTPTAIFTALDAPTPLIDLTTRPGEVQADYALDLPFNRFRFQSPTTVVSA